MAALSGNVGTDKGGLTNGSLSNQQLNILRDKLDVLTLLPELVKKGLISSADSDIIRRYRHVSVQREKVLDSVQQGGSFAVNVFLDVLSAEDHQLFQLITAEQNSSKTVSPAAEANQPWQTTTKTSNMSNAMVSSNKTYSSGSTVPNGFPGKYDVSRPGLPASHAQYGQRQLFNDGPKQYSTQHNNTSRLESNVNNAQHNNTRQDIYYPQYNARQDFNPQHNSRQNFNPQFNSRQDFNPQYNLRQDFNPQFNSRQDFNPQLSNGRADYNLTRTAGQLLTNYSPNNYSVSEDTSRPSVGQTYDNRFNQNDFNSQQSLSQSAAQVATRTYLNDRNYSHQYSIQPIDSQNNNKPTAVTFKNSNLPFGNTPSQHYQPHDGPNLINRPSFKSKTENGEKVTWEVHSVTLNKVPGYGFGIAVSGGRDNPHFANGDTSIVISDILKGGPAEGKLQVNDRLIIVNGLSLDNVDHSEAIAVLRDSGNSVHLVVRRKIIWPEDEDFEHPIKVTLAKRGKRDEFGIVLGCRLFIKEIANGSLAAEDGTIKAGDNVIKINNIPIENLSLSEARKTMERSRDKLQLVISKASSRPKVYDPESRFNEPITSTRAPDTARIKPLSLDQLDRPATPLLVKSATPAESKSPQPGYTSPDRGQTVPVSPPVDNYLMRADYGPSGRDFEDLAPRRIPRPEPRFVSFRKEEGSVGIRVTGGNRSGIFVAKVANGSPASYQGLVEGDLLQRVNGHDMTGKTHEDAVLMLMALPEHVSMTVQYCRDDYLRLTNGSLLGDSFYVRVHFDYRRPDHGEMSFIHGEVFHVTETLYQSVIGSWQAFRLSKNDPDKETEKGIIPNSKRAEQLAQLANQANQNISNRIARGGSFLKKKVARRSKSTSGRDARDDTYDVALSSCKFPAYERVLLMHPGFIRPVIIFGALADVARDYLFREAPRQFESPPPEHRGDHNPGVIRFSSIRNIMDRGKHCLLDITTNAVDRLSYEQFAPIVVFLKVENKIAVKELREKWARNSKKSPRKLYENSVFLLKHYSYLFTNIIPVTDGESWLWKMKEAIEKEQQQAVWMSEVKFEDVAKDDVIPLSSRLSYSSSPDNAHDTRSPYPYDSEDYGSSRKLARSSSDPNIAQAQQFRQPYGRQEPGSRQDYHDPYDRYYLSDVERNRPRRDNRHYHNPHQSRHPYSSRARLDPYATLTPSERLYDTESEPALSVDHLFNQLNASNLLQHQSSMPPIAPAQLYDSHSDGPRYHEDPYLFRNPPRQRDPREDPYRSDSRLQSERPTYLDERAGYSQPYPEPRPDEVKPEEKLAPELVVQTQKAPPPISRPGDSYQPRRPDDIYEPSYDRYRYPDPYAKSRYPGDRYLTRPNFFPPMDQRTMSEAVLYDTRRGYPAPARSQPNLDLTDSQQMFKRNRPYAEMDARYPYEDNRYPPQERDKGRLYDSRPMDPYPSQDSAYNSSLDKPSGSAFESYQKSNPTFEERPELPVKSKDKETEHKVIATARGIFDSNGGVLESKETGVSIIIPKGAIPEGVQQEIYFKVCQDNSILPPLDRDKGETLLSPLVMCGPHGLQFLQPVELRLPHSASVNPDNWSFALKSNESPAGKNQPGQWQNVLLSGDSGVANGKIGKDSVSVLVDHF